MNRLPVAAGLLASALAAGCSSLDDPAESLRVGAFTGGGTFTEGALEVAPVSVATGETAQFALVLVDSNGVPVRLAGIVDDDPTAQPVTNTGGRVSQQGISAIFDPLSPAEVSVSATSTCGTANQATLTVAPLQAGPALITGTYLNTGCSGADPITVRVSISRTGATLTATGLATATDSFVRPDSLGATISGVYVGGVLDVDAPALAARGQTAFAAGLANNLGQPLALAAADAGIQGGALRVDEIGLQATSACVNAGRATVDIEAIEPGPSPLIRGTYTDAGCGVADTLTLTATIARTGQTLAASSTLNVAPDGVDALSVEDLSVDTLRLEGLPGVTETVLTFTVGRLEGDTLVGIPGRTVNFEARQSRPGVASLSAPSGVTGANGQVSVVVRGGRSEGTVSVVASILDTVSASLRSTQSDRLRVINGVPINGGLSLSTECSNIEGANVDGNTVSLQALVRDLTGLPVVDGQIVQFQTTAGGIVGECVTSGGACQVDFRTQAPRQADGIARVLAFTEGQESFTDLNGNGRWNPGEAFDDAPEVFTDLNGNGQRDANEPFIDSDNTGGYSGPNGQFDGYSCEPTCGLQEVVVADAANIVMSTSNVEIDLVDFSGVTLGSNSTLTLPSNAVGALRFYVRDLNGNPIAAQSTLSLSITGSASSAITINSPTQTADCDNNAAVDNNVYDYILSAGQSDTGADGVLQLRVRSPSGSLTTASFNIRVEAAPVAAP